MDGPDCAGRNHPTWDKLVRRACNGLSQAATLLDRTQPARAARLDAFRRCLEPLTTWAPRYWSDWAPTDGPA